MCGISQATGKGLSLPRESGLPSTWARWSPRISPQRGGMGAHRGEGQGDEGDPRAGLESLCPEVQRTMVSPPWGPRAAWVSSQWPSQVISRNFSICYRIAMGMRFLEVKNDVYSP